MSDIATNLKSIQDRINTALLRSGRKEGACELLIVSKTWPAECVADVITTGCLSYGENKVQEAEQKAPRLNELTGKPLNWHLIGHLQRNKVRKALSIFQTIHSIDSLKLARYTSNIALEIGVKPDVYIQVDLAGESSKTGYEVEALKEEFSELCSLEGFKIKGLMCIPPVADNPEGIRPWFAKLRNLRDDLESQAGISLPGLSMGMSGDFEIAIEEGSTIVRVGSAIFGSRNYP